MRLISVPSIFGIQSIHSTISFHIKQFCMRWMEPHLPRYLPLICIATVHNPCGVVIHDSMERHKFVEITISVHGCVSHQMPRDKKLVHIACNAVASQCSTTKYNIETNAWIHRVQFNRCTWSSINNEPHLSNINFKLHAHRTDGNLISESDKILMRRPRVLICNQWTVAECSTHVVHSFTIYFFSVFDALYLMRSKFIVQQWMELFSLKFKCYMLPTAMMISGITAIYMIYFINHAAINEIALTFEEIRADCSTLSFIHVIEVITLTWNIELVSILEIIVMSVARALVQLRSEWKLSSQFEFIECDAAKVIRTLIEQMSSNTLYN